MSDSSVLTKTHRTIGWRSRVLALAGIVLVMVVSGACNRFRTSEEIRLAMHAGEQDTTWMRHPCQLLVVDEFWWRADSLQGVQFRVHPSLVQRGSGPYERLYQSHNRRSGLRIYVPRGLVPNGFDMGQGLQQLRFEECSIGDRIASVVTGRSGFEFHTRVVWRDIGNGTALIATARGRSLEEVQLLRGVLFTMRFPGGYEQAVKR